MSKEICRVDSSYIEVGRADRSGENGQKEKEKVLKKNKRKQENWDIVIIVQSE